MSLPTLSFLTAFGVYSVSSSLISSEAFAYYPNNSVQSVKFTRSSRDNPEKPKKQKVIDTTPTSPFAPGTHNVSLGIGQVFLLGALGNSYENAIGPELHYSYGVSDLFAFESNFGYHSHSNGNLSIWNLAAGLRTNMMYFDQLVPFINVGLGFYHPSLTYASGGSANTLLFGLQLGGGIDLLISKQVFFGTRLTYNDMFDSTKKDSLGATQSLGGAFISFVVHAGYSF